MRQKLNKLILTLLVTVLSAGLFCTRASADDFRDSTQVIPHRANNDNMPMYGFFKAIGYVSSIWSSHSARKHQRHLLGNLSDIRASLSRIEDSLDELHRTVDGIEHYLNDLLPGLLEQVVDNSLNDQIIAVMDHWISDIRSGTRSPNDDQCSSSNITSSVAKLYRNEKRNYNRLKLPSYCQVYLLAYDYSLKAKLTVLDWNDKLVDELDRAIDQLEKDSGVDSNYLYRDLHGNGKNVKQWVNKNNSKGWSVALNDINSTIPVDTPDYIVWTSPNHPPVAEWQEAFDKHIEKLKAIKDLESIKIVIQDYITYVENSLPTEERLKRN